MNSPSNEFKEAVFSKQDQESESLDTDVGVSHQDALEVVQSTLQKLMKEDPLLCDLPTPVTLEEVNSLIALESGRAMSVNVRKADDDIVPIIVEQTATVVDLKKAIQRHVTLQQARLKLAVHISWRYVWRTYWLYFDGQKLDKDHRKLKDYGIRNRDEVSFIKKLREK